MHVELTREEIWALLTIASTEAKKDVSEGTPLRKAYMKLAGQVTGNA